MVDWLLGLLAGIPLGAAAAFWWLSRDPAPHRPDHPRHPAGRAGRVRVVAVDPDGTERVLPRCPQCGAHVADEQVHARWCQVARWNGDDFDA